ncbi:glycosyltransferase [Aetokthonos hydrillicola Thurmond2011]|jgi:glycosyltransferase involved in cell wall biosynthesis|uniref:Glycosyltransferase n=1 Tax=Aetokthonos hydrillicola Thurmond2011 TaxID=2712845 RepID=A0AAP5IC62_9CYAN|nr:glycosyltransferase family 2 protein [Aetokthonos hydrillicola]MBO3458682.1 glycosyltransferase family 2 protein [Aetokthonos hydrillicola CCALA 1050]MBW4588035.1 glycosyltransferase [Aetokthonos hydrillicola CCALA 1050]MDR9897013.1 glycosyltransferase [Aetokthonos hydrillicola Thurmond2011]
MSKISIVTPCYNTEKYIAKAIDSVIASTFTDWDYVIVDDGSTDKSLEIILNYVKEDPRLQLIKQRNFGVCNARNNGAKICSSESEYLMFLDADDCIEPEMLEIMVKYLDQYPNVGLLHSDTLFIDSEDNILNFSRVPRFFLSPDGKFEEVPDDVPQTPFLSIATGICREAGTVLRKSIYMKTSGWPEFLGQGYEGIDLFIQMALLSDVHYISKKLYKYRQHESQSHKSRDNMFKLIDKWKQAKGLTSEQQEKVNQVIDYLPAYEEFMIDYEQLMLSI